MATMSKPFGNLLEAGIYGIPTYGANGDGLAMLRFYNEKESFTVPHESFFPTESFDIKTLPKGTQSLVLDYEDGNKAPFFFKDVNFDGKRDLILNLRKQGQRHSDLYRIYLFDRSPYDFDLLYRQTERLPFTEFDEFTRLDPDKEEIVIYKYGGAYSWTEEYYRLNKDSERNDFELYKIRERQDDKIYEYEYTTSKRLISKSSVTETY